MTCRSCERSRRATSEQAGGRRGRRLSAPAPIEPIDEPIEDLNRFGQRGHLLVIEGGHLLVQQRAILRPELPKYGESARGQADQHGTAIAGVAYALHPATLLETVDQQRDRRLCDPLVRGQLRDSPGAADEAAEYANFGHRYAHAGA